MDRQPHGDDCVVTSTCSPHSGDTAHRKAGLPIAFQPATTPIPRSGKPDQRITNQTPSTTEEPRFDAPMLERYADPAKVIKEHPRDPSLDWPQLVVLQQTHRLASLSNAVVMMPSQRVHKGFQPRVRAQATH